MTISLSKLRSFVVVAEESQFSRAAARLGVSQPTLSAQIKELENILDVSLFSRTTRSVILTAEGERFLGSARQLLADVDVAVANMREQGKLAHGRLVIGSALSVPKEVIVPAVDAFSKAFPEIQIHIHESSFALVEDWITNGTVDLGFGYVPSNKNGMDFFPLYQEKFYGVVAAGHPLAKHTKISFRQLLDYPFMTTAMGTGVRSIVDGVLRDHGLYLNTRHTFMRTETILEMVAKGMGVTFLPATLLLGINDQTLRLLEVSGNEVSREMGILQRKGGSASSAASAFIQFCMQQQFSALIKPAESTGKMMDKISKGIVWSQAASA